MNESEMTNEEHSRYLRALPRKKFLQWKMRGWGLHLPNRYNTRRNRNLAIQKWWNRQNILMAKWRVNRKS